MSNTKALARIAAAIVLALGVAPARAAIMATYDLPDTSIASNTVIDIVEHNGGIWMATGQGLNFTMDNGQTWLLYNNTNGLRQNDISALRSFAGRLWVASAYTEIVNSQVITFSDSLQYTDDDGALFETARLGAGAPFAFGAQKTIYDIAAGAAQGDDWVFMANFAGGFVGSRDGGEGWRRLYASSADSTTFMQFYTNPDYSGDLPYRLRAFSCAADTTHGDTMMAWAGTADGVLQYVYAPRENKPNSRWISDIEFCSDCLAGDTTAVFIAGDGGVTRASTRGQVFHSTSVEDGLPGRFVSDLHAFAGRLFAAAWESRSGNAAGLAVSDDGGETFTDIDAFIPYTGPTERIHEIIDMQGRLYAAMETVGLWVSHDTGATWQQIYVDSSNMMPTNRRNVVWGLDALADTLRVGTDSGLVTLYMDPTGAIDSSSFKVFLEQAFASGTRVLDVFTQVFTDTLGQYDSSAVWTINRAVSASGAPCVYRGSNVADFPTPGDTTFIWTLPAYQQNVLTNDLEIIGDTVLALGHSGMRWSDDGTNPSNIYYVGDTTTTFNFDHDTATVMAVFGDTVLVGSHNGFAISHNLPITFEGPADRYKIFRPNLDSLAADFVVQHTPATSTLGIAGSFIPAMGLQEVAGEPFARIWLACQPGAGLVPGQAGISVGRYEEVGTTGSYDLVWDSVLHGESAWNFAFNGDTVFAAGDSAGVLISVDGNLFVWDTIPLVDASDRVLVEPGVPVYAVSAIGDFLWVGTDQSTVRLRLDNLIADTSYYYVDLDSPPDEVYAYPVPLRMSSGAEVDFHLTVEPAARVTLEIYDAAMHLVARVMDNQDLAAGVYHGRQTGLGTWDGRNGEGETVAVGVYYFKVEYSTGDVRWGKLAVIP